ncbi:MAG: Tad domain-containing protein [Polyangiaceae bacterium]
MTCPTRQIPRGCDDRGAVMLIAVFFAVFAVAMLYLAIGAGEAVLHREHLQDAADSAALSGAITHARIMNVLVLINMVMVTLLAILVTLKLIEGIAIVGMAIAAGLAWCTAGGSLAAIPPLKSLQSTVSTIYEEVKPTVFSALETLHTVGDEIAESAPMLANSMAQSNLYGREDGIVQMGIATTTVDHLPVEDDSFEGLCGRAGGLAKDIAGIPLKPLPGWGTISGALDGPMKSMTRSLSEWFCGDGENGVPDLDLRESKRGTQRRERLLFAKRRNRSESKRATRRARRRTSAKPRKRSGLRAPPTRQAIAPSSASQGGPTIWPSLRRGSSVIPRCLRSRSTIATRFKRAPWSTNGTAWFGRAELRTCARASPTLRMSGRERTLHVNTYHVEQTVR